MADISINKFRVQIPREGATPATPGFVVSEGQDPVNPPGSPTGIYVPYLGATSNVDLGEYGLSTGNLVFDTTPTNIPTAQGSMYWDADDETVALIMNGAIQKIGEDSFYQVKNQTGSNIAKGVAVRFAGTVGNSGRLLIAPFLADGTYPSTYFMGVTMEAIANGEDGKVMWFGRIRGINTNAYNEGDILYASTTVAGGFQTTVPVAPNNIVEVCAVVTKSATVGTIFVRPTLGSNINRDEGVKITSPQTGDLLQRQSNGLFENRSLASIGLITGSGTTNYVSKFTGTGSLGNSQIFDNGTNVGIGTNTPNSILELSSITPILRIQASLNSEFHGIEFRQGLGLDSTIKQLPLTGELRITNGRNSSWGGFITLYTDTFERARITPNGRLLIGTTTENSELVQIAGTVSLQASATASTPTQIPVFIADPASTTRTLVTRTPAQLLSDLGADSKYLSLNIENQIRSGGILIRSATDQATRNILQLQNSSGTVQVSFQNQFSQFNHQIVLAARSNLSTRAIRRDELYLNYSETVATAGTINDLAIDASTKLLILTACDDLTGVVPVDNTRLLRIEARGGNRIIRDQNAGSLAANRFALGADLTINDGEVYQFIYTNTRWRRVL